MRLKYLVNLPTHRFPGECAATFEEAAFLWNGGNTPSERKMNDPEFRERVEKGIERCLSATVAVEVGQATVWPVAEESAQ